MSAKKDLVGQKFGYLTVMERVPVKGWRCHCDCGNECIIATGQLTSGNRKSCGRDCTCEKKAGFAPQDLTGQIFGSLTALSYNPHFEQKKKLKWVTKKEA